MATLIFTFETGAVPLTKIVDDFATHFNYDTNKIGAETKANFARRMVRKFIVDTVKYEDSRVAANTIPLVNEIDLT